VILAKKVILVEGPSDELVIQKAFMVKHNKLPIEAGVDVINVRGLSFARFLDIATELKNEVAVVTDNDGDYKNNIEKKYLPYSGVETIKVYADKNEKLQTLEPQIVAVNDLTVLNKILGKTFETRDEILDYMIANKTECALKIFETSEKIAFPAYVETAVL
jgi:predicted ATP-dependent endonuclease of OLD family